MTDEQKVYIRGVEGRGSEVIKMLTDLGADCGGFDWDGNDPKTLYFISYEGDIGSTHDDDEIGRMLQEYRREIHLPEPRKDDDIFVNEGILD